MDERDVRQIAEDMAEKVLAEAFDRVGLSKDGRPDWSLLTSLVTSQRRKEAWRVAFIKAALPTIAGGLVLAIISFLRIGEYITMLFSGKGPPQP